MAAGRSLNLIRVAGEACVQCARSAHLERAGFIASSQIWIAAPSPTRTNRELRPEPAGGYSDIIPFLDRQGPNQPIEPQQVGHALSSDNGIAHEALLAALPRLLPTLIDRLSSRKTTPAALNRGTEAPVDRCASD
jgi:hypothetical protein